MPGTTKGEDIFQILNNYLVKWDLSWKSCIGICTDGAPSMVGSLKDLNISKGKAKSRHHYNLLLSTQRGFSCKNIRR